MYVREADLYGARAYFINRNLSLVSQSFLHLPLEPRPTLHLQGRQESPRHCRQLECLSQWGKDLWEISQVLNPGVQGMTNCALPQMTEEGEKGKVLHSLTITTVLNKIKVSNEIKNSQRQGRKLNTADGKTLSLELQVVEKELSGGRFELPYIVSF